MIYPFRMVAVVTALIAGLSALDMVLARTERTEVAAAAERSWKQGTQLLHEGRADAALDSLRNAHTLERGNTTYELDLISALAVSGHTAEADPLIEEALLRKPDDGPANLAAARLKVKEGDVRAGEAFYHRAIYGEWQGDAATYRRAARFELIELLAKRNSRAELTSELIALEADAGGDNVLRRQIASYFLEADAPSRAVAVYRSLLEKNPDDADAYEGLGDAELRLGDYRAARNAFIQVAHRDPNRSVAPRLILLNEVIELDPTPRRLPTAEKYARSVRILALAKGDLEARLSHKPEAGDSVSAGLLKDAADRGKAGQVTNEQAERNLDLAERIWKRRVELFGVSTATDEEPLRLTMEHLTGQ